MAGQISTYTDVYEEMLTRVNDPDGDTYTERAKELVYEGIVSLAVSGQFEADQIPSLVTTKTFQASDLSSSRLKVSGESTDFHNYNIIKIIGITDDIIIQWSNPATMTGMSYFSADGDGVPFHNQEPQTVIRQKYIPISLSEVNRLNDPEEQRFYDEIYYYRRDDYLYFFPTPNVQSIGQRIIIHYLKAPSNYELADVMTERFSLDFMYKVIDYGVGRIREEQAGQ